MWQEIWKLTIGSALPWHNCLMPWCSQWHTGSRRKCLAWTEWLRFGRFILICIDSDSNETSRTQDIKEIEDTSLDIAGGKLCMSFASFHSSMLSLLNFFLTRPVAGHKETEDRERERERDMLSYIYRAFCTWRVTCAYIILDHTCMYAWYLGQIHQGSIRFHISVPTAAKHCSKSATREKEGEKERKGKREIVDHDDHDSFFF